MVCECVCPEVARVAKLTRKNLVVDAEKIRALAERRGTSESEAVRQAVEAALADEQVADDIMAAMRQLHALGGIRDVFHKVPPELKRKWRREARPRTRRSSSPPSETPTSG